MHVAFVSSDNICACCIGSICIFCLLPAAWISTAVMFGVAYTAEGWSYIAQVYLGLMISFFVLNAILLVASICSTVLSEKRSVPVSVSVEQDQIPKENEHEHENKNEPYQEAVIVTEL